MLLEDHTFVMEYFLIYFPNHPTQIITTTDQKFTCSIEIQSYQQTG